MTEGTGPHCATSTGSYVRLRLLNTSNLPNDTVQSQKTIRSESIQTEQTSSIIPRYSESLTPAKAEQLEPQGQPYTVAV